MGIPQGLEHTKLWRKLLARKDELTILELADLVGASPGRVAAAFRRTNTPRSTSRRRNASGVSDYMHLLGTMRDADLAEIAGMTPEAVGQYRRRAGIPSYQSKVVAPAKPKAAPPISVDYEEEELPPEPGEPLPTRPAPAPVSPPTMRRAIWRVQAAGHEHPPCVVGTLAEAARTAERALGGRVQAIEWVGDLLEA